VRRPKATLNGPAAIAFDPVAISTWPTTSITAYARSTLWDDHDGRRQRRNRLDGRWRPGNLRGASAISSLASRLMPRETSTLSRVPTCAKWTPNPGSSQGSLEWRARASPVINGPATLAQLNADSHGLSVDGQGNLSLLSLTNNNRCRKVTATAAGQAFPSTASGGTSTRKPSPFRIPATRISLLRHSPSIRISPRRLRRHGLFLFDDARVRRNLCVGSGLFAGNSRRKKPARRRLPTTR